eukprot:c7829_g1_i2 orf=83-238(+)
MDDRGVLIWGCITIVGEQITIFNIYAPNNSGDRDDLWQRMDDITEKGKHII